MNYEQLEKRIAALLDVPDEKSGYALSLFKKMLSDYLAVGEALTIENLGIFQLKEQISHSSETKLLDPSEKALTLIFSPESAGAEQDYLFINIELEDKKKDYTEFDENVFELGLGKPLVTDTDLTSEQESSITNKDLENSITVLFENSQKNMDFDLWDDHLKIKEQMNILDIENDDSTVENSKGEEEEEKFVTLDDDEVLNDYEEESDIIADELGDNLIDELDLEEDIAQEYFNNEIQDEIEQNVDTTEEIFEKDEESLADKLVEGKNEESLEQDRIEQKDDLLDEPELLEQEDVVEQKDQRIEEPVITENSIKDDIVEETKNTDELPSQTPIEQDLSNEKNESLIDEKSNNLIIILLIAAFIIIAGISSYYIFFGNSISVSDQQQITVDSLKQKDDLQKTENISSSQDVRSESDITKSQESEETKLDEEKASTTSEDSRNILNNEREVSKNIFFDGTNYSIQVSSWKQIIIAEREEQKLINKGYQTFIQEVYIPKFDGTWNRVRIGPFASLKEAKEVQAKLNK